MDRPTQDRAAPALAARIDDDGRLSLDGQWADDLSLVALALDDVLGGDEGDG